MFYWLLKTQMKNFNQLHVHELVFTPSHNVLAHEHYLEFDILLHTLCLQGILYIITLSLGYIAEFNVIVKAEEVGNRVMA